MNGSGRILVVCKGNVCRSPYIERLLAAKLSDLGVQVSSAGTGALVGRPMEKGAARLLRDAGIWSDDFVARQLTPELVRGADLVLTATREIRREVVRLEPRALHHAHAFLDFGDLVKVADLAHPTITEAPNVTVVGRLAARAVTGRGQVTARFADDSGIVDPYRKRARVHEAMARQVEEVLSCLVTAAHEVAGSQRSVSDLGVR